MTRSSEQLAARGPKGSGGSDEGPIVWRARAARLAFRKETRHPERLRPLWPVTADDSTQRDDLGASEDSPGGASSLRLRQAVAGRADSFIELVTGLAARALSAHFDQAKAQLALLRKLESFVVGVSESESHQAAHLVWGQVGRCTVLALLDELVDGDTAGRQPYKTWAAGTERHLDRQRFTDACGIDDGDICAALSIAARAMTTQSPATDPMLLSYRDRWLSWHGADEHVEVQFLEPLLGLSRVPNETVVVPYVPVAVYPLFFGLCVSADPDDRPTVFIVDPPAGPDMKLAEKLVIRDDSYGLPPGVKVSPGVLETMEFDGEVLHLRRVPVRTSKEQRSDRTVGITYVAPDRVGLLAELAEKLHGMGINITAAADASIGCNAGMSFVLRVPETVSSAHLESELGKGDPLIMSVADLDTFDAVAATAAQGSYWNGRIVGPDRPGLVLTVAETLRMVGGRVVRCSAATNDQSDDTEHLLEMLLTIHLPNSANPYDIQQLIEQRLTGIWDGEYEVLMSSADSIRDLWFQEPITSSHLTNATALTVMAVAQDGLLEAVCHQIRVQGFNIVDARVSVLDDYWNAVFALQPIKGHRRSDPDGIGTALGLTWASRCMVATPKLEAACSTRLERYELAFDAVDRPGVVANAARALAEQGCIIDTFYAHVEYDVSPRVGKLRLVVGLPAAGFPNVPPPANEDERYSQFLDIVEKAATKFKWLTPRIIEWNDPCRMAYAPV